MRKGATRKNRQTENRQRKMRNKTKNHDKTTNKDRQPDRQASRQTDSPPKGGARDIIGSPIKNDGYYPQIT